MSKGSAEKTGLPIDQVFAFDLEKTVSQEPSLAATDTVHLPSETTVVSKAVDAETVFDHHCTDAQIAPNDIGLTADEIAESLVEESDQEAEVLTQVEDEEWPTIGGLEDSTVEESVEVAEVLTPVEDEEWPSIRGLVDPSVDESVEVAEVLTPVEDEEWPSIPEPTGPSSIANPSPLSNQEVAIDQFKISALDPSGSSGDILSAGQNLDSGSNEQISAGVSSSEEPTFVETSQSTISPPEHGELVIPGLDSLDSLPTEPDQNKNVQGEAVPPDDFDESSFEGLGKLRFAGDDE